MSASGRSTGFGILLLLGLQVLWHGLLLPPSSAPRWLLVLLFCLPLLPSLLLLLRGKPSAWFWGGVAALFYFCHGITEAWTIEQARTLAVLEIVLSVWIIVAGSWDGMKARFSKRKAPPGNV
jgi:uncharacterized membrane protein